MPDLRDTAASRLGRAGPDAEAQGGAESAPVLGTDDENKSSTTTSNGIRPRHLPLDSALDFAKALAQSRGLETDDTLTPHGMRQALAHFAAVGAYEHIRAQYNAVAGDRNKVAISDLGKVFVPPSVAPAGWPEDVPPCAIISALALIPCAVEHSHGALPLTEICGRALCGTITMEPVLRDGVLEIVLEDASRAAVLLRGLAPDGTLVVRARLCTIARRQCCHRVVTLAKHRRDTFACSGVRWTHCDMACGAQADVESKYARGDRILLQNPVLYLSAQFDGAGAVLFFTPFSRDHVTLPAGLIPALPLQSYVDEYGSGRQYVSLPAAT